MKSPRMRSVGEFDPDDLHEFEGVGGGGDALSEFVIKAHLTVSDLIAEISEADFVVEAFAFFAEFHIVRRDRADGARIEKLRDDPEGGDAAFEGVCAVEDLVKEIEERFVVLAEIEDALESVEFGHKERDPVFEGVFDAHTGGDLKVGRKMERGCTDGCARVSERCVDADGA